MSKTSLPSTICFSIISSATVEGASIGVLSKERHFLHSKSGKEFQPWIHGLFPKATPTYLHSITVDTKINGETISDINSLNNGDGISFFDNDGNYQGVNVNKIEHGRIVPGRKVSIPKGERHPSHV